MLEKQQKLILSEYRAIYDLVVPKDNLLRKINDWVDFEFIYEELSDKYSPDNGRNAINPITMFKYLLLKTIYDLSDVDVVDLAQYDMSFKYFLGMAPEDPVINPSSLTKFRKLRLKDTNEKLLSYPKTADSAFFGDKTHLAMAEERIITAATITTGEKNDGKELEKSYEKSKDARMYICKAGHMAVRKARQGKTNTGQNQSDCYYFDIEKCKICPMKEGCYKEGAKSKTYSVTIKSDIHKEQIAFQETPYFQEKAKERYKIEAKNSELKHRHGYDVASSSGLIGMEMQGAMFMMRVVILSQLLMR